MKNKKSLVGEIFGKLTVIEFDCKINNGKYNIPYWKCKCECGTIKSIRADSLKSKLTKSCGCISKQSHEARNKLDKYVAAWNRYLQSYQKSAKDRDIIFDLSMEEFKNIVINRCQYCGIEPYKTFPTMARYLINGRIIVNGIDRKNSNLGYYKDNCVPCCEICNRAKSNRPMDEWINWINRIKSHNSESNN